MAQFVQASFDWMAGISLNNSREQFLALKPQYEEHVRMPFLELLRELSAEFGGVPKVFRPNRDIRFSADKRPYKTNISGFLEGTESAHYLELSLEGLTAATGYYQMSKEQLARYRSVLTFGVESRGLIPGESSWGAGSTGAAVEVEQLGKELREIMARTGATGEGLKTVPRGIPKDHINADILGFTSLTCSETLSTDLVLTSDCWAFSTQLWKRAVPLNEWLHTYVGPSDAIS